MKTKEVSINYNPETDYNGARGIALAEKILREKDKLVKNIFSNNIRYDIFHTSKTRVLLKKNLRKLDGLGINVGLNINNLDNLHNNTMRNAYIGVYKIYNEKGLTGILS